MIKKKFASLGLCAVLAASLFTGCGSANYDKGSGYYNSFDSYESEASYSSEMPTEAMANMSGSTSDFSITDDAMPQDTSRKLITTVRLNCETQEYDTALNNITDRLTALGGYIENMDTSNYSYRVNRSANMTIRVPAKNLKEFLGVIEENTNVTNYSRNVEDVTLNYVDTESHITALKTEQQRLNELLAKADSLEDMLTIEDRLTSVRYQLESYESMIRTYDNKIDYATITLYLDEVVEYTEPVPDTVGTRISQGLKKNFKSVKEGFADFFVGLVVSLPYLLVLLFVVAVVGGFVCLILWICGVIASPKRKARIEEKNAAKKLLQDKRLAEARIAAEQKINSTEKDKNQQ